MKELIHKLIIELESITTVIAKNKERLKELTKKGYGFSDSLYKECYNSIQINIGRQLQIEMFIDDLVK